VLGGVPGGVPIGWCVCLRLRRSVAAVRRVRQSRAGACRGPAQPAHDGAVLSIDRALKLMPYTGVENIERRVLAHRRDGPHAPYGAVRWLIVVAPTPENRQASGRRAVLVIRGRPPGFRLARCYGGGVHRAPCGSAIVRSLGPSDLSASRPQPLRGFVRSACECCGCKVEEQVASRVGGAPADPCRRREAFAADWGAAACRDAGPTLDLRSSAGVRGRGVGGGRADGRSRPARTRGDALLCPGLSVECASSAPARGGPP
jgi:hypothetical protein